MDEFENALEKEISRLQHEMDDVVCSDYHKGAKWGYNYALQSKIVTDLVEAIKLYDPMDINTASLEALQNYESQIKKMGDVGERKT